MASPASRPTMGAYGLRLGGLDGAQHLLTEVPRSWPMLRLGQAHGAATHPHDTITSERAVIVLRNGGEVVVARRPPQALFRVPNALDEEELIHPYLAPVAAVVAYWLGRESLHAGSFVAGEGVWALVGDRESGKSSTLAGLARAGYDVFGDDVLVLSGNLAYAGPRTLDLRADAAVQLGEGALERVPGARDRRRLRLGPVVAERELRGIVFLEWGDETGLRPLLAAERLRRVAAARALRLPPHPARLLELAGVPAWLLRRPRAWGSLPPALEVLTALTRSPRDPRATQPEGA